MRKILTLLTVKNKYDYRLLSLYALNVTDYIFTLILLSSGLFVEANPIMSTPINGFGGFALKCILPLILLTYLHIRFCISDPKHPKTTRFLLNSILVYYTAINVFHIFWLICLAVSVL